MLWTPNFCKIPCIFPVIREFRPADEFGSDCILRQAVSLYELGFGQANTRPAIARSVALNDLSATAMPGSALEGSCIWTARACSELRSVELRSFRLPLTAIRLRRLAASPLRVLLTMFSLFYRIGRLAKDETTALSAWPPGGLVT